jgi:hypothetical protein
MRRTVLRSFAAAAIAVSFIVTSCLSGTECVIADVSPKGWSEPIELQYFHADSLSQKQIDLILRHDRVLEKSTGRYALEVISPSGSKVRSTLTIDILPDTQRNRLAEVRATAGGIGLSGSGDYRFVISPLQNTTDVWSVGIELK